MTANEVSLQIFIPVIHPSNVLQRGLPLICLVLIEACRGKAN